MSDVKYYFDPEYCREISLNSIKSQYNWFKSNMSDFQSFDEFLKDNFVVCSSREELERLISYGGYFQC